METNRLHDNQVWLDVQGFPSLLWKNLFPGWGTLGSPEDGSVLAPLIFVQDASDFKTIDLKATSMEDILRATSDAATYNACEILRRLSWIKQKLLLSEHPKAPDSNPSTAETVCNHYVWSLVVTPHERQIYIHWHDGQMFNRKRLCSPPLRAGTDRGANLDDDQLADAFCTIIGGHVISDMNAIMEQIMEMPTRPHLIRQMGEWANQQQWPAQAELEQPRVQTATAALMNQPKQAALAKASEVTFKTEPDDGRATQLTGPRRGTFYSSSTPHGLPFPTGVNDDPTRRKRPRAELGFGNRDLEGGDGDETEDEHSPSAFTFGLHTGCF